MSTIQSKYGTEKQGITISLAPGGVGLANAAARVSTVIDNTTNLFLDALVQLQLKSGASGVSANGFANIYAYGTVDAADNFYPEAITGTDAALTLVVPTNLRFIGVINMVANATAYISEPMSVAAAFGGVLPEKWGIVIENQSGAAFDTTEANHLKWYQGVEGQAV
jgi:hypothetical protein